MLTKDDSDLARRVVNVLPGAFITGSYLVCNKSANDIDVVVNRYAWDYHSATTPRDPLLPGKFKDVAGGNFELQPMEGEGYDGGDDGDMYELCEHWRSDGVNILVINEMFYPAYRAAANYLEGMPSKFKTREERVAIHQAMKQVIRDMVDKSCTDLDTIPW